MMAKAESHPLFRWSWHHFKPVGEEKAYLPILSVLRDHEGAPVEAARDEVNREVDALGLEVGLGKRRTEPYADIFRDRIDVWRFTGSLFEPGLVEDEIRLTELGHALLDGDAPFDFAMARQALRLRFPRVPRVGRKSRLTEAEGELSLAQDQGPGVNVVRAWTVANALLREGGEAGGIDGDEAARFLSGATSLDDAQRRARALQMERRGLPSGFDPVDKHKARQGREIEHWLTANGALTQDKALAFALDPRDREFEFADGSAAEMLRWSHWWGSWPRFAGY